MEHVKFEQKKVKLEGQAPLTQGEWDSILENVHRAEMTKTAAINVDIPVLKGLLHRYALSAHPVKEAKVAEKHAEKHTEEAPARGRAYTK